MLFYQYYGCTSEDYPEFFDFSEGTINTPKNLNSSNIASDSAKITWDALSGTDYYVVSYGNNLTATTDIAGITLNNLTPGTNYQIKVMAYTANTNGGWSEEISVQTSPATTSPINEFTLDTVAGKDCTVLLNGGKFSAFSGSTFTMTYDPTKLTLIDFAAQTKAANTAIGGISETQITILSNANGVVTFQINKEIPAGKTWTGVLSIVKFRAITTGTATVQLAQ
jgi:hypothetical protein